MRSAKTVFWDHGLFTNTNLSPRRGVFCPSCLLEFGPSVGLSEICGVNITDPATHPPTSANTRIHSKFRTQTRTKNFTPPVRGKERFQVGKKSHGQTSYKDLTKLTFFSWALLSYFYVSEGFQKNPTTNNGMKIFFPFAMAYEFLPSQNL